MTKKQGAMGRNPFGKKPTDNENGHTIKEIKAEKVENVPTPKKLKPKFADWLLVDLPAESYVLGLKTVLLTKSIVEKRFKKLLK